MEFAIHSHSTWSCFKLSWINATQNPISHQPSNAWRVHLHATSQNGRLQLQSSINHHPMTSTLETTQSSPSPTPLKKILPLEKILPLIYISLHRANIELVCIKFQIWRAPVLALVLIVRAGGYRMAGLVCVGYYSVLAVGKGQGE